MHRTHLVIPYDSFIKRFVPPVSERRRSNFTKVLKNVRVKAGEDVEMCGAFAASMNDRNICPGFKFVVTSSRGGPSDSFNKAVEVGLYPLGNEPDPGRTRRDKVRSPAPDWSAVELCVECRSEGPKYDPFYEEKDGCGPTTTERKNTLERIFSHAETVFRRQQRTCIFMVLLLGSACRIVRFDRSGVVATKKFNYRTRGNMLADFLWRYSRWDADQRGHDTSAELIAHDSDLGKAMKARAQMGVDLKNPGDYVRRQFSESLREDWSWWKLRVDDENGRARYFLVGKPHFQAEGIAGRGTRGYIALDANNLDGPFYYLKDAWRIVGAGINKEGLVLKQLNEWHDPETPGETGVPYIPTLECHGDVRRTLALDASAEKVKSKATVDRAEGGDEGGDEDDTSVWQLTQTQFVWEGMPRKSDDPEAPPPFKKHKHYRIVVREVCLPMTEFKDSYQLVYALSCCIHAHSVAYRAGVIHRDISAGNVLLYYNAQEDMWSGLLNDWELSKQINSPTIAGHQLDRTGTWQFMSVFALDAVSKEIDIRDELESFFHVLLYFALRFLPHNCAGVAAYMQRYFDDYTAICSGKPRCGQLKKLCIVSGRMFVGGLSGGLRFFMSASPEEQEAAAAAGVSHPLNKIIRSLLDWFSAYYGVIQRKQELNEAEAARKAASVTAPEVPAPNPFFKTKSTREGWKLPPYTPGIIREGNEENDKQYWQYRESVSQYLSNHDAIKSLLNMYLRDVHLWPEDDKVADQIEKRVPKVMMRHVLTAKTKKGRSTRQNGADRAQSVKRKAGEMDAVAQQGRPKRRKSS